MKIALLNTTDSSGGAAVACRRLMYALNKSATIDAQMLVTNGSLAGKNIHHIEKSRWTKTRGYLKIVEERLRFKPYHNGDINPFYFTPGQVGLNLQKHSLIKSADIIHLHLLNNGFLSIEGLQKIAALGKPIVWTLHDMWAFTGGCHYSGDCTNYLNGCGNCSRFLKKPKENDLSRKINLQKHFFKNFHFVTCSNWLKEEALKSSLLREANVISIPNPIDTDFFKPLNKDEVREKLGLNPSKKYILFGAANLKDGRKGYKYLLQMISELAKRETNDIELLLFGKANDEESKLPIKVTELGSISTMEGMRDVYNAANLFVIPSLQDNLPNTIMEAMACGTPVVGFKTGGIPEMVDHLTNGYIAKFRDSIDLTDGIQNTLENLGPYSVSARNKVLENYTETKVSSQYIDFYNSIL